MPSFSFLELAQQALEPPVPNALADTMRNTSKDCSSSQVALSALNKYVVGLKSALDQVETRFTPDLSSMESMYNSTQFSAKAIREEYLKLARADASASATSMNSTAVKQSGDILSEERGEAESVSEIYMNKAAKLRGWESLKRKQTAIIVKDLDKMLHMIDSSAVRPRGAEMEDSNLE